jgi:succinate dehydrogenase/fumarate reductase flavoprotein subunit
MTEKLEARVKEKNIKIFDGYKVIGIITDNGECKGLLALNKAALNDPDKMFVLFNCTSVIMATGGPAGLYTCSVFPESQTGSGGIAFEAGVAGRNLTEWQYGIASVKFRWNLSGSYQQVIPRYVSTDRQGNGAREFLDPHFPDPQQMLDAIFLKGYQWPFDSRKIANYGSSLIDILVHQEIHQKGRRVFLDFLHNPAALQHDFGNLGRESYAYLEQSGAFQSTPIERLAHLNHPAIDLYKNNGIDLTREMLEIAVCAQHNNGGLAVNCWWETNVPHLFAVGEAAGTHGIYRPGGSALNSGQAGSTRAAMFIARRYTDPPMPEADFVQLATAQIAPKLALARKFLENKNGYTPQEIRTALGDRMSAHAAHIRQTDGVRKVRDAAASQLQTIAEQTMLSTPSDLITAFENVDLLTAQYVYAAAMENYIAAGGGSRGSYIIPDENGVQIFLGFLPDNGKLSEKIQEVRYTPQGCEFSWDDVRPIPENDDWFENVWRAYRDDELIR